MATRTVALPDVYDLRTTLGAQAIKSVGRGDLEQTNAWRATRTPDGTGTLHVRRNGAVATGEAWGTGGEWLLETMPDWLGVDDDPGAFDPKPGVVAELHRRNRGLFLGRTGRPFDVVIGAVLGQRVAGRQAGIGYRRLVRSHGEPAPGPREMWILPEPQALAALPYEAYHRFEIERARAGRIIEAARRAKRIEEILAMDRTAAWRRLEAISGIGPWTAGAVMGVAWGDRDAVPVGDYHLPNIVAWALAGEPRANDDRMLELLEPYAGDRRRALVLIKSAGIGAPKFGPRSPITTIRNL